jgi:uncharacterized protein YbdZ (MbtH family)
MESTETQAVDLLNELGSIIKGGVAALHLVKSNTDKGILWQAFYEIPNGRSQVCSAQSYQDACAELLKIREAGQLHFRDLRSLT